MLLSRGANEGVITCRVGIAELSALEMNHGRNRKHAESSCQLALFGLAASTPWDSQPARRHADLRAAVEIAGTPMGNLDMMIVAHALAAEAVLVTNDRSFRRLMHLKIEDWTKSRVSIAVTVRCAPHGPSRGGHHEPDWGTS